MKFKTFVLFVAPSIFMMFFFIAAPLITVFIKSFQVTSEVYEIVEEEVCTPTFTGQSCKKVKKSKPMLDDNGNIIKETQFVGFDTYKTVLETDEVSFVLNDEEAGFGDLIEVLSGIDFYRALRFTSTFTLFTLPMIIGLGLLLALCVDKMTEKLKGVFIFITLLPFIITPVIGAISIKWLFVGDGILTLLIEYLIDKDISVFANGWAIESLMMFYRVWHVAPFAFIVFYAGLQSVDRGVLDASVVDGASRLQRLKYVIIPHLMPLIVFVSLIHLMDAFRVFEEVIGFSSEGYRISLQWLTYSFLVPDDTGNRAISRASATSMLTMIGIVILLIPVIISTFKTHKSRG